MKKIISVIIILFSASFILAQDVAQKPLAQTEYVKMLYDLQKKSSSKDDLIEAIRRRGIGFELTDGLRGLTRTKSKNDSELQRTLEEANRRRQNPGAAKLPSEKEAGETLEKTRTNTLAAVDEMPDFVVKQLISRSFAYAGTNNYRNLDRLVVAVNYRSSGQEEYKLLSRNGILENNPTSKQTYGEVGGTSSTGEFVTVLAKIFKPESDTKFEIIDTDTIRNRPALVFTYSIIRDKAKQQITSSGAFDDSVITGMDGKIWIDRANFRVLRVESAATEIPESFRIRSANRTIDYDWVTIADEKYLLPLLSDVRLTSRENSRIYETRNVIRFKDYQKYGSEVKILEEDEVPEEKPNQRQQQ
ncbi:MAG: hypothetical protein ACR2MG_19070 [Pyrinomonadaceae bacterium]